MNARLGDATRPGAPTENRPDLSIWCLATATPLSQFPPACRVLNQVHRELHREWLPNPSSLARAACGAVEAFRAATRELHPRNGYGNSFRDMSSPPYENAILHLPTSTPALTRTRRPADAFDRPVAARGVDRVSPPLEGVQSSSVTSLGRSPTFNVLCEARASLR